MNRRLRTFLIWVALLSVVICAPFFAELSKPAIQPASRVVADAEAGQVTRVGYADDEVTVTLGNGRTYRVTEDIPDATWDKLDAAGIPIVETEKGTDLTVLLMNGLPLLVLGGLFLVFFFRYVRNNGTGNILQLRQHKAKQLKPGAETLRFADVGGAGEVKERLADVVDAVKHPERWKKAGARMPRGVLLEGPPGCGKTLLARAVAGEAGVPVFVASGSEFVEMFVGVGAARVRDLFENARKAQPAVIFIDELDAVGRRRGAGIGWGHDEREQTLNQLLVCLDGFERDGRLVVIAATNRAEVLDKALLRPGRFDVRIAVPDLDEAGRREVWAIHTRGKTLAPEVSLDALAARTAGLNGAAIEQVANDAAMEAVRRARHGGGDAALTTADFDAALARWHTREKRFDAVDQLLFESASQLAQPSGAAHVRVTAVDGSVVEGRVAWADASFLKIETDRGGVVVPKANVRQVEPLTGTTAVDAVAADPWNRAE